MEHFELVHAVSRSQVELHVMQAGVGGVGELAAGARAAVGPVVAIAGHLRPVQGGVAGEGQACRQVLVGDFLDPLAIAVIQVAIAGRPAHTGQAVFGVPSLRSGQATVRL